MERYMQHFNQHIWLDWLDCLVCPIYAGAIFLFASQIRDRILSNSPLKKFFTPALALKIFGSIASALVYQYYYQGGDTFNFYTSASYINSITFDNLEDALLLQTDMPIIRYPQLWVHQPYLDFVFDSPSWFVVRMITMCSYFTFDTYMGTGLFFAVFSFYGSWRFFTLICKMYPDLKEQFFYCVFAVPSVVFWGSGVFKDTLTMSALLLFLFHTYNIVIERKSILRNLPGLFISFTIVATIRSFFIVLIIPSFALWYFVSVRDKIRNKLLKMISLPILLVVAVVFASFGLTRLTSGSGELSREALTEKSKGFQSWHSELGGSSYTLGDIDYSNTGIMLKMPEAINVTLFRPYVWEAHSFFQLIAALQSLYFAYFFIKILIQTRLTGFFVYLLGDSLAMFSFFFSLLYAFVAGFTSFNFGALDRYKIPCLPFFLIALILVNYKFKKGGIDSANRKFTT